MTTMQPQPILTDLEIMEMLDAFYSEALQFLEVPREQWAAVKGSNISLMTREAISVFPGHPPTSAIIHSRGQHPPALWSIS